ncbi:hypothetical protein NPIL_373141 [Nephila pilipes]|uniref:C2H2-type domain-containing protein n=1 Tax=Nephila pilipes TaxID=299642 RepID=A0A8X6T3L1_NEPPI|nr:hypothetical protein NPIL_373141 [Nephila pilipes]
MDESNDSVLQEYDDYEPCVCIVCFQEFEHYDELEEHCQIHNGGKPPCCEICNQSFLNESDLSEHQVVHFPDKPIVCDICGIKNTSESIIECMVWEMLHVKPSNTCDYS